MKSARAVTHVLVDGVRYPDALRRLYGRDDLDEIEPLYLMTRWSALAEQGPILARLKGTGLADEARADGNERLPRALSLLSSEASTDELGDHLRQCVTFQEESQSEKLLRFADPLVTRHWLASYGSTVPAALMGPIATWWVADWSPNWAEPRPLRWQAFHADDATAAPDAPIPPMGPAQLAALDTVARWRLKERLTTHFATQATTAWHALPVAERGDWLDTRFDDAIAWGASTERQLAIWVDLSLHCGEDFITARDGLYACWVATLPPGARPARPDSLYALDAWCRLPEAQWQGVATSSTPSSSEVSHG